MLSVVCRVFYTVMLSVTKLSFVFFYCYAEYDVIFFTVVLSVTIPSVMFYTVMLSVITLNVITLNVIVLMVIMLNVVMLSVVAPCFPAAPATRLFFNQMLFSMERKEQS